MIKKYIYIISIVALSLLAAQLFFKFFAGGLAASSCQNMKDIASDIKKVEHIKSKVSPYYGSSELLDVIGKSKYLDKNFNPLLFDKIGIDWRYIGLPEYFVQIYFDGAMYNEGDFQRIRLVFGRDAISIDLTDTASNYLMGGGAEFNRINVSQGVSIFCSK